MKFKDHIHSQFVKSNIVSLLMTVALSPFLPLFTHAGVFVSTGGEVFVTAKNPWFIKGSRGGADKVNYCVNLSEDDMSINRDRARTIIREALDYWKDELAIKGPPKPGFLRLADQEFIENEFCSENTPLQFKLGYSLLDKDELDHLKDPQKYIGVSIRKEYDKKTLSASGVVLIGSDKGSVTYHNPGNLVSNAWKSERLFKYAVLHELGHVFGMPHGGSGLMSETFLEQILNKQLAEYYQRAPLMSFRKAPRNFEVCSENGNFHRQFFQVASEVKCLLFEDDQSGSGIGWNVLARTKGETNGKPELAIGYLQRGPVIQRNATRPTSILHFDGPQEIFSEIEMALFRFMIGPLTEEMSQKGDFVAYNKIKKPSAVKGVFIDLKPESVTILGQNIDGQIMKPVLTYSVPSLLGGGI